MHSSKNLRPSKSIGDATNGPFVRRSKAAAAVRNRAGLGWIFGLVLAAMAWQDYSNHVIEETYPVRMRLRDLLKRKSIGNKHITLTDFTFGDGYACETGAAALVSASVHVFPNADVGESVAKPHTIFAIVESWGIQDEDELLNVIRQEDLTGVLSSQSYWPGVTRGTTNRGQSRHDCR